MKNLLRSSLYLFVFALAGILFQISCSNSDNQPNAVALNKIVYTIQSNSNVQSIWTSNYDSTGAVQVPITLPANIYFNNVNGNADAKISPDGQKIFFLVVDSTIGGNAIYSCNIDGTNLIQVVPTTGTSGMSIGNAI